MPGFNNLSVASFSPATGERTAQPKPKLRSSCDKCRSAKVRCDKNKPRCERCTARKVHCNYSVARKPNIAKTRHTSEATTPEPKTGSSDIPEYTNNEHFMQFPTNMDNPASRCSMPFLDTHGAVPKSGLQQDETSDFLDLKPHSSEISSFEPIDTSHCEKLVCDISHRLSIDLDGCNTGEHLIHTMDQVVKSRQAIDDLTELLGCRTPRSAMLCASLPAKQSIPCNMAAWQDSIANLGSKADTRYGALEMMVESLSSQWNNMNTTQMAHAILEQLSKLQPAQLMPEIRHFQERLSDVERLIQEDGEQRKNLSMRMQSVCDDIAKAPKRGLGSEEKFSGHHEKRARIEGRNGVNGYGNGYVHP